MTALTDRIAALGERARNHAGAGPDFAAGYVVGWQAAADASDEVAETIVAEAYEVGASQQADFMAKRYRERLAETPAAAMREVAAAIREASDASSAALTANTAAVEQAGYQAAAGAVAASMILMEPEETTAELRAAARKREAEAR